MDKFDIRDLQVGDWVKVKDLKDPIKRISGIDDYRGKVDFWDGEKLIVTSINNVLPIPLTGEILEKNRFEKQDDGWYKITLEEENLIGVQPFENVNWIFGANVFPNIIEHLNILYVHELQHALRLCGVEKEITV